MSAETAQRMVEAARVFFDALDPTQRAKVSYPFDDETQRHDWHYVPRERAGLPLKEMDESQRRRALDLVGSGLSAAGRAKAETIISLEPILAALEGPERRNPRDPGLYYVTLFGAPGDSTWGWRFEGHHISLNNTVVGGELASAPLFFGSNPAHVRHGEQAGLRALKEEEDLGRDLLSQLDGEQKRVAIVSAEAPPDILTTNVVRVGNEVPPAGLTAAQMTSGQRQLLEALVQVYVGRLPEAMAQAQMERLRRDDLGQARFAWAGVEERGGPHYYRVQGAGFLAEYDNTQNDANHIHAVWRDLTNDFGADLLARHLRADH